MKNIIQGFKKAYNLPTLPNKINNFYNHIFTRIFRFIGGLSVLVTLTKSFNYAHLYFNDFISEIINISTITLASIFIIFHIIINIIKIVYGIYLLKKKPETFEIRNSPLNLFASQIAKILYCVKIGCVATGSTAAVVAGGITFDTIIEKSGRDPIFIPMMADGINLILGKPLDNIEVKLPETSPTDNSITDTDFNQDSISNALNNYKNLSISEKEAFWKEVSKEFKKS